jgi:LacI family transcriptional regulator
MKKEKATIHDIAKKLNITASTVSRALKDHPRISDETKKLVIKAAEKLNYQANNIAAALRNGRSNTLGIIVPTADRSFFASVIRGIEEIANKAGYNVMICQTYDSYQKELDSIEALLKARVDGIIISHGKETENFDHLKKVKERGIPLIMFDRSNDALGVSQVVIDDYFGAYRSVEHLIEQGCKKIAHFTNIRKISIFKERLRGYKEALANYGIPFDPSLVVESNLQLEDGRESMIKLLAGKKGRPDAIFSASALGAVGAMQVLKERNIKIPDDVALVAFSNEVYTSFTDPPLTAVDQHSMRMGNSAAEIFLEQITRKEKFIPNTTVLHPELIIRESSLRKRKPS